MTCVLGIETSCDETGVAIVRGQRILANVVASQIELHAEFGGVVPEIASRQHLACISQLVQAAIDQTSEIIDAVAVTIGPGLMGSLLVGASFAKGFAFSRGLPFIPVHHIEGHIFSAFLDRDAMPEYPFLSLVVSGGHTCLFDCSAPHRYTTLGTTRDDAVGESFDKVARLLGLSYPGGPSIQKAAVEGNPKAIRFPRGLAASNSLEFSYSGLKTAVLYELRKKRWPVADVAASFQDAAIDTLVIKTKQAVQQTQPCMLVLAGGVAANHLLRDRLTSELDLPVLMPSIPLCVDNGAMIALAGLSCFEHGRQGNFCAAPNPGLLLETT